MNLSQYYPFKIASFQVKRFMFISIHEDIQRYDNLKVTEHVQILHRLFGIQSHRLYGYGLRHPFQNVAQITVADIFKICLVVDVKQLEFVHDDAYTDYHTGTTAFTSAL